MLCFKVSRLFADYCIVVFNSSRDSLTDYAWSSFGGRGKRENIDVVGHPTSQDIAHVSPRKKKVSESTLAFA